MKLVVGIDVGGTICSAARLGFSCSCVNCSQARIKTGTSAKCSARYMAADIIAFCRSSVMWAGGLRFIYALREIQKHAASQFIHVWLHDNVGGDDVHVAETAL
jgi:hypothetical protein